MAESRVMRALCARGVGVSGRFRTLEWGLSGACARGRNGARLPGPFVWFVAFKQNSLTAINTILLCPSYTKDLLHVPLSKEAVWDCMPVPFELLEAEAEPQVRAVLGHFVFVYIHPYMDGNGRLARFLMNLMLSSGGYAWTVIPVEQRPDYMEALEQANSFKNIEPFVRFISRLVTEQTERPLARPR